MDRKIHFQTIQKTIKERLGVDVDTKEFINNKTGEVYNIIFEKGTDVALFSMRDNNEYICLDSNGDQIEKENIYSYINGVNVKYDDSKMIISEKDLIIRCKNQMVDIEELVNRESELFPERTTIVLKGMFSTGITNFYVDEIVEVNEEEFKQIRDGYDSDILVRYNEKTYGQVTDGIHGILVIGPDSDGIMVDTQGYDYARYMSYAPQIGMPIQYMIINKMREEATLEMKLYVPLKVEELDREMGDTNEIAGEPYLREIRKQVYQYNLEDGERGLASYFGKDNISRNKVYSIKPDVEMVRDTMMGVAVIKMTKPLTQTEIDDLKDYVTGQFSDGWGESFEQHEIRVSGGEIYVHFWNSEEYYINTDEEMEQMLEQNMNEGMQSLSGM